MRITVVTPSFNQAPYLEATLRSVLHQGYDDLEYLVLDGGSTDGSREIIARYADRLAYWRSRPDGGQAAAIAEGFSRATGDVLYWLNSDDVLLPGALQHAARAFRQRPEVGLVTGDCVLVDGRGRVVGLRRKWRPARFFIARGMTYFSQTATFFRRDAYERAGGIDPELHCVMDDELWVRMARAGVRMARLDRRVAAFRLHPESKGGSWRGRYAEEIAALTRRGVYPRGARRAVLGNLYRSIQLASGNYLRMAAFALARRGRPLEAVVPGATAAAPRRDCG